MVAKSRFVLKGKARDTYLELVIAFPLASIKSERHLEEAQRVVDRLLARGPLDKGAEIYLDALSDLVASYEDTHHPIIPASAADMLRHLMEAKAVTQAQLSRETAIPKSSISSVLSGNKLLSRKMVLKLADYFGVDVTVLAACT
jgi:HTH-type transcriptional regulator / antitoxin HigA